MEYALWTMSTVTWKIGSASATENEEANEMGGKFH
jgi:hypothetical protein